MSFKLSAQTKVYFKRIFGRGSEDKLDLLWDEYYLCLMVGFSNTILGKEDTNDKEITKSFLQAYRDQRFEIIASLIAAEIERIGIFEKGDIESLMTTVLDHASPTGLSLDGHRLMNRYVAGGFELIKDLGFV